MTTQEPTSETPTPPAPSTTSASPHRRSFPPQWSFPWRWSVPLPPAHSPLPTPHSLLLAAILLLGASLRFLGWNWGEYQYLHPDERFLIWVGADIQPVDAPAEQLGTPPNADGSSRWNWRAQYPDAFPNCTQWGGYFDTSCSPLNPHNMGHSFYVYGTLPMLITRYLVQGIYGHSGFNEMTTAGRLLSAAIDLLTLLLIYLIATRLYHRRVGLLAAAFYAVAVLPIQQSHFFTMDTFSACFVALAFYLAACILRSPAPPPPSPLR